MNNVFPGTGLAETIVVAHCSANVMHATTRNNLAANPNFGRQALYSYGTSDQLMRVRLQEPPKFRKGGIQRPRGAARVSLRGRIYPNSDPHSLGSTGLH